MLKGSMGKDTTFCEMKLSQMLVAYGVLSIYIFSYIFYS